MPPNLSYCTINGHQIFLDIDEDRYFRLSGTLAEAFRAYASGCVSPAPSVRALVEQRILVPASCPDILPEQIAPPARSALELASSSEAIRIADLLRVSWIVWRTRRALDTRPLKEVLDRFLQHRGQRRPGVEYPRDPEERLLGTTSRFSRSRLYVPIDTCCLLDSLALATYLADIGVAASIVFGVTDAPFSAHCWVQVGDVVLNDTVGNTMAYTPIRTV